MKRIAATLFISIALLALPATALANGSSTSQGYSHNIQSVQNTGASRTPSNGTSSPNSSAVSPASATATTADAASTLPFTGIDVVLLAAGGVALLGAGLLVRRLSVDN